MGAQDNAAAARALNDAFNARDIEAAIALCTPDVELVNVPEGTTLRGPDGVRQFFEGWTTAFPDANVETKTVVADENTAVIEFIGRGTQTGPLVGQAMTIPPTGKRVELTFIAISDMRGGKIASIRNNFDMLSMLTQLGLVPAPAHVQAGG